MRNWRILGVIVVLALLLDLYVFQAVKSVSQGANSRNRMIIYSIYWSVSIGVFVAFALLLVFSHLGAPTSRLRNYLFAAILGLFLAKLLAAVFFLVDDIRRLVQWCVARLSSGAREGS